MLAIFVLQSCSSGVNKANGQDVISSNDINLDNTSIEQNTTTDDHEIQFLTKSAFLEKIWNYEESPQAWNFLGEKPVLIDFYADWCGPCRKAAPILEEVYNEYADRITVYKIDTEAEKELQAVFGVQSIPSFLYIPLEGRPVMSSGIARTDEDTKNMFVSFIDKYLLSNN